MGKDLPKIRMTDPGLPAMNSFLGQGVGGMGMAQNITQTKLILHKGYLMTVSSSDNHIIYTKSGFQTSI